MIATYLEDKITPVTELEAFRAIRDSFRAMVALEISKETLAILTGHCALETGRWRACHWNNWGNIKAGNQYKGYYTCFRLNEVINGKIVWFSPDSENYQVPPGHPQTRMRAHLSSIEGATAHMAFLIKYARYNDAWQAALQGKPDLFVQKLKDANYFTANLVPYQKAVESLFREYVRKIESLDVLSEQIIMTAPEPVTESEPERSRMSNEDLANMVEYLVTTSMHDQHVDFWDDFPNIRDRYLKQG